MRVESAAGRKLFQGQPWKSRNPSKIERENPNCIHAVLTMERRRNDIKTPVRGPFARGFDVSFAGGSLSDFN
jgi:hypothetical protein